MTSISSSIPFITFSKLATESYALSIAFLMAASGATTGWTSNPVMNLMSSIAKMLLGLAMATVSRRPLREMGTIWNLFATSPGISLVTAWSGMMFVNDTLTTENSSERNLVRLSSVM